MASVGKRSPADFLKLVHGRPVVVKLNSGVDYRGEPPNAPANVPLLHLLIAWPHSLGVLACLDGYMNIAMEQTEEYVDGQLKAKYGDAFIRGNNGTHYPCANQMTLRVSQCCTSARRRGEPNNSTESRSYTCKSYT